MWNLVHFFTKNSPFFTWLFLAVLSCFLLFGQNPYHRSVWLTSANDVTGTINSFVSNFTGYFGLRQINEDLLELNGCLEAENLALRQQLLRYAELAEEENGMVRQYDYRVAHVVNNSITQAQNYITLNKGAADGVTPDLGVADHNGIVGIISSVSDHYSLVISVLNPKFRLSAKLQNSEFFGSLMWDGSDYRYVLLQDLPRTISCQPGDTVVTTGYSTSFPEGVPVGTVVDSYSQDDNNFITLKVSLFTDFSRLNDVHIIMNAYQQEQKDLQVSAN